MRVPFFFILLSIPGLAQAEEMSTAAQRGRQSILAKECNRCHDVTDVSTRGRGVEPADQQVHCVDCHVWILSTRGKPKAIAEKLKSFPLWEQYLENIVHLTRLPDLGTLTRRVHPGFIRRFLDAPFDLRPHLEESMIPARLGRTEKDDIVAYLTELNGSDAVSKKPLIHSKIPSDRVQAGKKRFTSLGCPTCHLVGNERLIPGFNKAFYRSMRATAMLAPNLRYVRERLPRRKLVAFIRDPKGVDPKTSMPQQQVSAADAQAIADFLLGVQIKLPKLPAYKPPEIPLLKRAVEYDEVRTEVFAKICVHCHMNPETNQGAGGPGNTGGLSFDGAGLDLETYEGIKVGVMRAGERRSILKAQTPGGVPLLLDVLMRRHREGQRDQRNPYGEFAEPGPAIDSKKPGMPLGLPALTIAQISLIKTWIKQGAPGP